MKLKANLLKGVAVLLPALVIVGACTNSSRPANQDRSVQEEPVVNRFNRNVNIGFQGIMLGTPNKDVPRLLKQLTNVTQAEVPYTVRQNGSGDNASCYANKYEKVVTTFESSIIDTTEMAYEGYGMAFSDGDSITKIVFTIMETDDPLGVYNRLFPLFYDL